jgi:hypothetical protein
MSPRNIQDRNNINVGPARLKVEDEIYQAADQGITGSTTVEQVVPEEPTTPVIPGGDLISPPVLQGDYPVYEDNLLSHSTSIRPLLLEYPLSAQGYYERSLIVSDSLIVNMDNQLQYSALPSADAKSPEATGTGGQTAKYLPLAIRDNNIWMGHWYLSGGVRTMASLSMVHPTRGTITTTDARMRAAWSAVYSDGDFFYLCAPFGSGQNLCLFKVPVSGSWQMTHICDVSGTTTAQLSTCAGIQGNIAWIWWNNSGADRIQNLTKVNTTTGVGTNVAFPIAFDGTQEFPHLCSWVTQDGDLCFLKTVIQPPLTFFTTDVTALGIVDKDTMSISYQPLFAPSDLHPGGQTYMNYAAMFPCKPPGTGTMLLTPFSSSGLIYEFDINGYRDPGFPGGYSDPEYPSYHSGIHLDHANSTTTSITFYWTSQALSDAFGGDPAYTSLPYSGRRWWRAYVQN